MCPFIYPTWHFSHFSPDCCGVRQSSVSIDDSFGFWSLSTVGLMLLVCDKMPHKWRERAVEVTYCTYGDYWDTYLRISSDGYKKDLIFMISWCVTKVLERLRLLSINHHLTWEDRSGGCIWYNAMNMSINIKKTFWKNSHYKPSFGWKGTNFSKNGETESRNITNELLTESFFFF